MTKPTNAACPYSESVGPGTSVALRSRRANSVHVAVRKLGMQEALSDAAGVAAALREAANAAAMRPVTAAAWDDAS